MSDKTPTATPAPLVPVLSQFLSYGDGDVILKIKATTLINSFMFLTTANPTLSNSMQYAESIQAFADLTRVAQHELAEEMESQVTEATTIPETVAATEPETKPVIKAEVVESAV